MDLKSNAPIDGTSTGRSQTGSNPSQQTSPSTRQQKRSSKMLVIRRRSSRTNLSASSNLMPTKPTPARPVGSSTPVALPPSEYAVSESIHENTPAAFSHNKKLIQILPEEAGGTARQVEDEPFYHGFMTDDECKPLLRSPGDFLVRRCEIDGEMQYVITVLPENSNELANITIKKTRSKRLYYVYIYAFKTISDLIAYHSRLKKPLNRNNVCIVKGISKSDWELAHEQIERTKKLGEGAFGEVWEGTLNLGVFRGYVPVAIKSLHRGQISVDERIKFLREANLMLKLDHPHIIKFYGVATAKDPIMIVLELAPGGSLHSRIQDIKNPPSDADKIRYCAGGASGLAYLEEIQIIHRDIASRNCLLSGDDEVKLSDFGLSLLGIQYREKSMKNVPVRWLSPETLKYGRFTSKTDVWSFGITIWEIYSAGQEPYGDVQDIKEVRKAVMEQRLKVSIPQSMPSNMKNIMLNCLAHNPDLRPTFRELNTQLNALRPVQQTSTLSSKIKEIFGF